MRQGAGRSQRCRTGAAGRHRRACTRQRRTRCPHDRPRGVARARAARARYRRAALAVDVDRRFRRGDAVACRGRRCGRGENSSRTRGHRPAGRQVPRSSSPRAPRRHLPKHLRPGHRVRWTAERSPRRTSRGRTGCRHHAVPRRVLRAEAASVADWSTGWCTRCPTLATRSSECTSPRGSTARCLSAPTRCSRLPVRDTRGGRPRLLTSRKSLAHRHSGDSPGDTGAPESARCTAH